MRNCPAESRLKWSVRPQRSPEEYAPGCSQWSPKFLFAGISCEGDLHTSLGSLVDAKYVIGKRGKKFIFSGCMFAVYRGDKQNSLRLYPSLQVCHEANKMRKHYFQAILYRATGAAFMVIWLFIVSFLISSIAASQNADVVHRLDYDRNAPVDIREAGVEQHGGVAVRDIS